MQFIAFMSAEIKTSTPNLIRITVMCKITNSVEEICADNRRVGAKRRRVGYLCAYLRHRVSYFIYLTFRTYFYDGGDYL